jgi:hypothetical protein
MTPDISATKYFVREADRDTDPSTRVRRGAGPEAAAEARRFAGVAEIGP